MTIVALTPGRRWPRRTSRRDRAARRLTRALHYQCADAVREGSQQIVLATFEPEQAPARLMHAARRALPSKMRVFLDFAAGRLRERLTGL